MNQKIEAQNGEESCLSLWVGSRGDRPWCGWLGICPLVGELNPGRPLLRNSPGMPALGVAQLPDTLNAPLGEAFGTWISPGLSFIISNSWTPTAALPASESSSAAHVKGAGLYSPSLSLGPFDSATSQAQERPVPDSVPAAAAWALETGCLS